MSNRSQSPFTGTLTGSSVTVTNDMGHSNVSISWLSGAVTVLGTGNLGSVASTAITLSSTNRTVTIVLNASQINNFTIDASAGSCAIVASS